MEKQADIDQLIKRLLQANNNENFSHTNLLQDQLTNICKTSRTIFLQQPMLLELKSPIKIVGDIHGQFKDLLRIFELSGYPPTQNYLFLGDYVDRGKNSLQTISLLLCYKIKYKLNFFMLRGNHQCASITKIYGFYDQCKRRFNLKLWKSFVDVFNVMPICAMIQQNIICMHGGLSPHLEDINIVNKLQRPLDVPQYGLMCDLLWSDPQKTIQGWEVNNDRGISFIFGKKIIKTFLKKNDLDLICRAHQIVQKGFEFFEQKLLLTLFSAPNYCNQFDNDGGILSVDKSLLCSFQIIKRNKK